jgi:flagellar biosynthetic protein FliR
LRVGAAMSLLPAFGETVVPQRIRLVLALVFTAVVLPTSLEPSSAPPRVFAAGAEVIIGLMLGIGLRLFILALQTAGAIAASAMSLAQLFGGTGPEPQPAIGNLLTMGALALAVIGGLHVKLASFFIVSYQMLPAGISPLQADLGQWGIAQISASFVLAFSLAAPFVLASVVYNLALGVINKAMPQLMVTMVGAPLLTGGALLLMMLVMPLMLAIWQEAFDGFLANPYAIRP